MWHIQAIIQHSDLLYTNRYQGTICEPLLSHPKCLFTNTNPPWWFRSTQSSAFIFLLKLLFLQIHTFPLNHSPFQAIQNIWQIAYPTTGKLTSPHTQGICTLWLQSEVNCLRPPELITNHHRPIQRKADLQPFRTRLRLYVCSDKAIRGIGSTLPPSPGATKDSSSVSVK